GTEVTYTYFDNSPNLRSRSNLRTETHTPGGLGGGVLTATYAYDERYNIQSGTQTDFAGNNIGYTLQTDGRDVQSINYPGAGTHSFQRNNFGQVEFETRPDGVMIDPDYEP